VVLKVNAGHKFHGERLDKYLTECERRIATRGGWLAGEYSIADIIAFASLNAPANFPRIRDNPAFGALREWHARIAARPAVQRGIAATAP
jgi:glutathione S-transferase